jgi:hypothetical protein
LQAPGEILAAFVTGVASVVGGYFALRAVVRHQDEECEKRIQAFREGLDRSDDVRDHRGERG